MELSPPVCPSNPSAEVYKTYALLYKQYLKEFKTISEISSRPEVSPLSLTGGAEDNRPGRERKLRPQAPPSKKEKRCTICKTSFNSRNSLFRHLPVCRQSTVLDRVLTPADTSTRLTLQKKHQLSTTKSFQALKTTQFFEDLKAKPLPNKLVKGLRQQQLEYSESSSKQKVVDSLENLTGITNGGTFFMNKNDPDDLVEFLKDCPIYDTQTTESSELTLSDEIEPQNLKTVYKNHAMEQIKRALINTSLLETSKNLNANQGDVTKTFEYFNEAQIHAALGVPQEDDSKMASSLGYSIPLSLPTTLSEKTQPKPKLASRNLYEVLQADEDEDSDFDDQHPSAFPEYKLGHERRESIFSRTGDDELFNSE